MGNCESKSEPVVTPGVKVVRPEQPAVREAVVLEPVIQKLDILEPDVKEIDPRKLDIPEPGVKEIDIGELDIPEPDVKELHILETDAKDSDIKELGVRTPEVEEQEPELQQPDKVRGPCLENLSPIISELCRISSTTGLSLGVLHHGEIIHTEHFGYRDVEASIAPDNDTVYCIASLTKAITAAATGILVEQEKLEWDTPISNILPEFQRKDEAGMATVVDMLSHRTGLTSTNPYWIQRNQHFYMPKSEIATTANHLKSVRPFRSAYLYSEWGYKLATEVIERITRTSYGKFITESIFQPLGMQRTTIDVQDFEDGNVAKAYTVKTDGSPVQIPSPLQPDSAPLAGALEVKSTITDLLLMYKSLLHAHNDQIITCSTTTPDSPFVQMSTIFKPEIAIGENAIDDESYALGWVKSKLPRALGTTGLNAQCLQDEDPMPTIGACAPGTIVYHHNGSLPGMLSSIHLVPETETAIVVLSNCVSFTDTPDFVGQLVLETILGESDFADYIALSHKAKHFHLTRYQEVKAAVKSGKSDRLPSLVPQAYEGKYHSASHDLHLEIKINRFWTGLLMAPQNFKDVVYDLKPYDGDTFYCEVDREEEMLESCTAMGMWEGERVCRVTFEPQDCCNVGRLGWEVEGHGWVWFVRDGDRGRDGVGKGTD